MEKYPWYKIIESNEQIMQGDFVWDCPVVIPPDVINKSDSNNSFEIIEYDVVVMSQSCDIEHGKLTNLLVCPVYPLEQYIEIMSENSENNITPKLLMKTKNALRNGNNPGYHLLNKIETQSFENDFLLVDFRNVFGVSFEFLKNFIKNDDESRIRLLSPYREHLSQAFARYFMRVGLPVGIPQFK